MDREALVLRNRAMTEAFHSIPLKYKIRGLLLRQISHLPVRRQRSRSINRILLIRPDHLGDVLLSTPAIHALRQAVPSAEIHALVGPWSAGILSHYDEIDQILTLPFPGFDRAGKHPAPYRALLKSARHLRLVGYSAAVVMRHDHWWGALLAYLAGIPVRIGCDQPDVTAFLTDRIEYRHEHTVIQSLRLMQRWTGKHTEAGIHYHFNGYDSLDREYINNRLMESGIAKDRSIVVIHPGSGTWAKRWETRYWAEVADTLCDQLDCSIILTGSSQERFLAEAIASQMTTHKACILAGSTDLSQLAALMDRAAVVLGPDSGPIHLAAAVGVPTVALFGPADPVEFAPWGDPAKNIVLTTPIGCRPCRVLDWSNDRAEYHPCVAEITVAQVLEAARTVARKD